MILKLIYQNRAQNWNLRKLGPLPVLSLTSSLVISRVIARMEEDIMYKVLSIQPGTY